MGCRFAGDMNSFLLGFPNESYAFLGGNMANVIMASSLFCQLDITGNLFPFAFGTDSFMSMSSGVCPFVNVSSEEQTVVFAMGSDDAVGCCYLLHGFFHDGICLYATSVIAETNCVRQELRKVHQLPALSFQCDGGIGSYFNNGIFVNNIFFY